VNERRVLELVLGRLQQALDRRELATERAGTELKVQLGDHEASRLRLEDVAVEIERKVLEPNGDALALGWNGAARLDLVALVAAVVACERHQDHLLKVRNVCVASVRVSELLPLFSLALSTATHQ